MEETKNNVEVRGQKALKSGIWYTISSISVKAILIITTPIFTRLMNTTDYGIAATFTTWFSLLNVICSLNLWYSIGRAKIDFPNKLEQFVGSLQLLAFMFTIFIGILVAPFLNTICDIMDMSMPLVISLYVYLLFYPAVQLTQAKFKYLYKYKGNIAITIYTTISTLAISLLLVILFNDQRALGKSLGAVISTLLLSSIIWIFSFKNKNIKINVEYWKYALKISVPLILNSISLNILAQSDRIFIIKYSGASYAGIYSLTYSYAVLINIILNAINEAWLPWFHDTFNDKLYEPIKNNVKPLILFGCWFGLGCIALAPEAVMILGGKPYMEGIWVVPPVTLGIVCNYIFQHYEHIELHLKKTWYISIGTIIAAIMNIILNMIFIPQYGFIAAAYTTLVCYILLMILHHYISRKILNVHLYDDKFMYLSLIFTFIISCIFMILYTKLWIWRWIFISVISLIYIFFYKQQILQAIKRIKNKK